MVTDPELICIVSSTRDNDRAAALWTEFTLRVPGVDADTFRHRLAALGVSDAGAVDQAEAEVERLVRETSHTRETARFHVLEQVEMTMDAVKSGIEDLARLWHMRDPLVFQTPGYAARTEGATCPECRGAGLVDRGLCGACSGRGAAPTPDLHATCDKLDRLVGLPVGTSWAAHTILADQRGC